MIWRIVKQTCLSKLVWVIFVSMILGGCAGTSATRGPSPQTPPEAEAKNPVELQNIQDQELEEYAKQKGVIIGKTDFSGVLKTSYVKLSFEGLGGNTHKFILHIDGEETEKPFPWPAKTVKPGYFFIELPVGEYKVASVSIPVGTTMAVEETDVRFKVTPNTISYLGTLSVIGTKEKIKLGGVPLIKPGFDYTIAVHDETEEAVRVYNQRYPNFPAEIFVDLMKVSP